MRPLLKLFILVPVIVPAAVYGLGIQMLFVTLEINNTLDAVIITPLICTLPFAIKIMTNVTSGAGLKFEEQALTLIIATGFTSAAEQVAESAGQISKSSTILAQGTSERSGSLSIVFHTLNSIKTKNPPMQKNESAKQLSVDIRQLSEIKEGKMTKLLISMDQVVQASDSKRLQVYEIFYCETLTYGVSDRE